MTRKRGIAAVAAILLLAGCDDFVEIRPPASSVDSGNAPPETADLAQADDEILVGTGMANFAACYSDFVKVQGRAPANWDELLASWSRPSLAPLVPSMDAFRRSGYEVAWKSPYTIDDYNRAGDYPHLYVLAFPTDLVKHNGKLLMADYSVRYVTPDQFASVPRFGTTPRKRPLPPEPWAVGFDTPMEMYRNLKSSGR